jgi:hypothetical protein
LGENITFYDYGVVTTNWVGGIDVTVDDYSRVLYCVQLRVNIYVPGTYNSVLDFADTPSLQRASWLMQYNAPTTPVTGAGFQLALWDILQDGADGFDTGNVRSVAATPSDVLTAALSYEALSVGKRGAEAIIYDNYTLDGTPQQKLIGFWPNDDGPTPSPEPSAIILLFSGLALIGLSHLRRWAHK